MLSYSKISNPLLKPFKTSFGTQLTRDAVILTYMDESMEAYAEAVTDEAPLYGYEDNYTLFHVINNHLKTIFSPDLEPEKFNEKAKEIRGHNMAKGAMEMLLWDINAKREGKPLHKFLGKSKGYADVGISIGMSSIDDEMRTIEESLKKGYRRIKVKIERGFNVELLRAIRNRFGDIPLSADANQGFTRDDFKILKKIDEFNLIYIEQPLPLEDINGHALLRKEIKTPICLDESIESVESATNAIERGAVDVINIKPGRVGGLQNSLDIMEKARERGVNIWIGGMLETGIGRSFNISLASNSLVNMPGDTSPNSRYFKKDITNETFEMKDGRIAPLKGNGIGVTLDYRFLSTLQVEGGRLL
ncbi:MAG: o-succinylbenzoate synthase [Candidatus Thermoplasmatota archaeon]|nr:o-succinylbenzoate synthase [Candidatus Thermoplasmatota archaeon]MCL5789145.1 o-succinylbenzoate synthase [Candidatus Thermoplasmatota archaeon]